jgi:predicted  nucleic acid-binding Zn-ribbon protein
MWIYYKTKDMIQAKQTKKESAAKLLDELQALADQMQELNKEQEAMIRVLLDEKDKLVHEKNTLFGEKCLIEAKVQKLISENSELRRDLSVASSEARGNLEYLIAERSKSWWDKLWE